MVVGAAGAPEALAAKRTTCSKADLHGDARLGPKRLPNAGPLATVLAGYKRLAGMTAKGYLRTYYDSAGKTWRYPPQGGYQVTPEGQPVKMQLALFAGQRIDRFGSEFGGYLSPEGTPYGARGIPPQSLDSTTAPATCNYSRYRVLQDDSRLLGTDRARARAAGLRPAVRPGCVDLPRQPGEPQRRLPRRERLPRARRRLIAGPAAHGEGLGGSMLPRLRSGGRSHRSPRVTLTVRGGAACRQWTSRSRKRLWSG